MASGIINGTTSNRYIDSKIEWSSTPINANNKSEVTASLYYRRNNTYTGTPTSGTGTFGITIDGQSGSTTFSLTIPNSGAWVKAVTVKKTVSHNNDGKKSITISASGSIPVASLSSTTCSGTAVLDNIPRQVTLTSAPNFTDEENPTINYSNLAGNNVTSLDACISFDSSKDDIKYRAISKTGTSYTFNLTEEERKVLRSATTGKTRNVVFFVRTVLGGVTYYSTLTKTLSIVNGNPTFTSNQIAYADTSAVKDITENPLQIVQDQSNLSVTFTDAIANKEATISKYDITVNDITKTVTKGGTVDFGKIHTSSNTEISITVTDSRGFTTTATKEVIILDWAKPIFTAKLERLNNYEDETYLTVDASISSVNGKNTMRIWYEYAERDGIYSQQIEIANNTKTTLTLDRNKAYDFNIVVEDAFDYSQNQYVLDKGKFPLFIDTKKNAVGINDFPAEGEALRVSGGISNFVDGVKISGNVMPDFVVEQGTSGIWIYRKWASGIAECWGKSEEIEVDVTTQWGTLYSYDNAFQKQAYPFEFITQPVVVVRPTNTSGNFWLFTGNEGTNKETPAISIVRPTSYKVKGIVHYFAIGRWK